MTRRYVFWAGASALALFLANRLFGLQSASRAAETFEVSHSDAEWRALLTPPQYAVLGKFFRIGGERIEFIRRCRDSVGTF